MSTIVQQKHGQNLQLLVSRVYSSPGPGWAGKKNLESGIVNILSWNIFSNGIFIFQEDSMELLNWAVYFFRVTKRS